MSNPQIENGYTKIANELLEAICKTKLSGQEIRVCLYIIRRTYGYFGNKKSYLKLSTIAYGVGLSIPRASEVVGQLINQKIILSKTNGMGRIRELGINKKYGDWNVRQKSNNSSTKVEHFFDKSRTPLNNPPYTRKFKRKFKRNTEASPDPLISDQEKEEINRLAATLKMGFGFNLYKLLGKIKRFKGYLPPPACIIKISNSILCTKPKNIWGYFIEALKTEMPKAFADLNVREGELYKDMSVSPAFRQIMKEVANGKSV